VADDGEDEDGKPRYRAEIKLHDKNQANFTLLKYFGALPTMPEGAAT
jgi:hypothetical protein